MAKNQDQEKDQDQKAQEQGDVVSTPVTQGGTPGQPAKVDLAHTGPVPADAKATPTANEQMKSPENRYGFGVSRSRAEKIPLIDHTMPRPRVPETVEVVEDSMGVQHRAEDVAKETGYRTPEQEKAIREDAQKDAQRAAAAQQARGGSVQVKK